MGKADAIAFGLKEMQAGPHLTQQFPLLQMHTCPDVCARLLRATLFDIVTTGSSPTACQQGLVNGTAPSGMWNSRYRDELNPSVGRGSSGQGSG